MKRNYSIYKLSKLELAAAVSGYAMIIGAVSILFYNSLIPCIMLMPAELFLIKETERKKGKECRKKLQAEFKDMIESLAANMSAGYSLEKAFAPVYEEIHNLYRGKSDIEKELDFIRKGIALNTDIEILLKDFGMRSGVADIKEFAEVVSVAKKSGGNLVKIIRRTADNIKKRQEVENEINTVLAAKKMEQRIMSCMPCAIVLYMRIANRGYMNSVYGNAAGIIVMTICFIVMAAAIIWGRRIVDIEV